MVAHRGGGILAPENTLIALEYAAKYGFHAVEFDVMLSKDYEPVLMHDVELGRTIAGTGKVSDYPWQVLATMDAGSWLSPKFSDARPCSYAQAMDFCRKNGLWMNVEIKPEPGIEALTGEIVASMTKSLFKNMLTESIASCGLTCLPLFSSFSLPALQTAQRIAPDIPRGFIQHIIWEDVNDWQEKCLACQAFSLHVDHEYLTPTLVRKIKAEGLHVFCYTVNTPARMKELLSWGVDALCIDQLDNVPADLLSHQ